MRAEKPFSGLAWSQATLRKNSFFRHFDQRFITRLLQNLRVEFFAYGEIILHEGEEADKLYCLEMGEVDVLVGPELQQVGTLGEGAVFGEMAMFRHACAAFAKRSSTIRAVSKCMCRVISYRVFHEVMKLYPQELQPFQDLLIERLSNLQDPASTPEAELIKEPLSRLEDSRPRPATCPDPQVPSGDLLTEASSNLKLPGVDGLQELTTSKPPSRSSRRPRRPGLCSQKLGRQDKLGVGTLRQFIEVRPMLPPGIKRISDISQTTRPLLTPRPSRPHSVLGIAGERLEVDGNWQPRYTGSPGVERS